MKKFIVILITFLCLLGSADAKIHHYKNVTHFFYHSAVAQVDKNIDPKLQDAANIAQKHARKRSISMCWRYVKEALLKAGAVNSYPKTTYAFQAGNELVTKYGFTKTKIRDPYKACFGSIIVYKSHVEIRTRDGFVSDYHSKNCCFFPLLGVYVKYK